MTGDTVLAALEAGARALRGAGIPYALIGGAALPAWGRTRATADADFLISLGSGGKPPEEQLSLAIGALRAAGFAHLEAADRRRIEDKSILHFWFPLRQQGVSLRLDLIAAAEPEYEEVLSRSVVRKVDGFSLAVASCEDLILLKLAAGRPVDLADASDLIQVNRSSLDRAYLESRAANRGLSRALGEAWGGSGLSP